MSQGVLTITPPVIRMIRRELRALEETGVISGNSLARSLNFVNVHRADVMSMWNRGSHVSEIADLVIQLARLEVTRVMP